MEPKKVSQTSKKILFSSAKLHFFFELHKKMQNNAIKIWKYKNKIVLLQQNPNN